MAQLVPHLAPETLHQLIRYRGLDACGELVASATPEQIAAVFDLDLWRNPQPATDERFDGARFGEWIEALVEGGSAAAARIVAALDHHLVIAGLAGYVRVFDPAALSAAAASDDEASVDVMTAEGLACEVGGYVVRSRRTDGWDAIVTLLVALDAEHRDCFHALMRGCRTVSNSLPERSGFDELLLDPAQLLHDVALARENRRSRHGYLTPADARAFLQMARQTRHQHPDTWPSIDPLAAAYFRAAVEAPGPAEPGEPAPSPQGSATSGEVSHSNDAVVELLAEAGLVPGLPRALLEGAAPETPQLTRLRRLMDRFRDTDDGTYLALSHELAFLANTLMAGCSIQSRAFTTQEASDAAAGVCNLGLEQLAGLGTPWPDPFAGDRVLVSAFEVGWAVLHENVSLFVADHLIATLADLRHADTHVQRALYVLRRELVRHRETPWRARHALEVIAMLDPPAWAGLLGLLDECPVLPVAVRATLEGRTAPVSPTTFELISTARQIADVRAFTAKLFEVLLR